MSLIRTKEQFQQQWRQWFAGYAVAAGWDTDTTASNRLIASREMDWVAINNNLEQDIQRRIAKIDGLVVANLDPSVLDPDFQLRYDFLHWLQS